MTTNFQCWLAWKFLRSYQILFLSKLQEDNFPSMADVEIFSQLSIYLSRRASPRQLPIDGGSGNIEAVMRYFLSESLIKTTFRQGRIWKFLVTYQFICLNKLHKDNFSAMAVLVILRQLANSFSQPAS